jgi:hypothetical protein
VIVFAVIGKSLSMMSVRSLFVLFIHKPAISLAKAISILASLTAFKMPRVWLISFTFYNRLKALM